MLLVGVYVYFYGVLPYHHVVVNEEPDMPNVSLIIQ